MIIDKISEEKLEKYFAITGEALEMAKCAPVLDKRTSAILDMVERYVSDARHFEKKGEKVLAFAALNYAHGWLDCGASLKLFDVRDDRLFTVDGE